MANVVRVSLSVVLSLYLVSCAAALVGGAFYKVSKTREQKRQFMKDFNETNLERQKLGLQPLDLCTEKYNFDEKWAKDDPECKVRVEKYEAGDKSALGNPELKSTEESQPKEKSKEK